MSRAATVCLGAVNTVPSVRPPGQGQLGWVTGPRSAGRRRTKGTVTYPSRAHPATSSCAQMKDTASSTPTTEHETRGGRHWSSCELAPPGTGHTGWQGSSYGIPEHRLGGYGGPHLGLSCPSVPVVGEVPSYLDRNPCEVSIGTDTAGTVDDLGNGQVSPRICPTTIDQNAREHLNPKYI